MTSRERVKAALNHVEPDKVPIDFGGQDCSMMHITCVAKLRVLRTERTGKTD